MDSLHLKDQGNRCFQKGNFSAAESFYSQAIVADPKNAALYTNRAMARIKLQSWTEVVEDCSSVLSLPNGSANIKANYYLAQAHLELSSPDDALPYALKAHALCAATNDKSLTAVTTLVLRCKKERWERREKTRAREDQDLERMVMTMLERDREENLSMVAADDETERNIINEETEQKAKRMRDIFDRARTKADQRRDVPDWAIDDISFSVMVDPVMTKTGKSYERASLVEHLSRYPNDPLTREPLSKDELRSNYGLRQACEEYLNENGWAVDW